MLPARDSSSRRRTRDPSVQSVSQDLDTGDMSKQKGFSMSRQDYAMLLLCFACTLMAYMDRFGFSIAYTKMADESPDIDQAQKGGILSAFYYGYATTQIPSAWLAARVGGMKMLTGSVILACTAAFFTPGDAHKFYGLCLARIAVGMSQGAIFPAIHTELGKKKDSIGPHYFSTVVSLITSGMYLGSSLAMVILPKIAAIHPTAVFKFQGAMGTLWLVVKISLDVLNNKTPVAASSGPMSPQHDVEGGEEIKEEDEAPAKPPAKPSIPWLQILSTPAIWALILNNFAFHYILYVLMAWLPTYFEKALGTPMKSMTLMNFLPFCVMFVFSNLSGILADRLIGGMGMRVGKARKLLNTSGFMFAATVLFILPGVTNITVGVLCISGVLGGIAVARGGFALNHLDVAPTYAGSVMSIANTAGTIAGIVGVSATGFLLKASGGDDWSVVFHLLAGVCTAGTLVFLSLATGERLF